MNSASDARGRGSALVVYHLVPDTSETNRSV
jgi:hypothetical protein